ncbi:hypothetical protein [Lactococcus lactis]|uniref:hypothetical protein n=1 Tax=Lactococcus lactis TaxID=1358 RepID=UPI001D1850C6|nr:hypothetical protein [Lactococcus lactis]MCC4119875.1 hypothetical protein [Lactococcus lactis]
MRTIENYRNFDIKKVEQAKYLLILTAIYLNMKKLNLLEALKQFLKLKMLLMVTGGRND